MQLSRQRLGLAAQHAEILLVGRTHVLRMAPEAWQENGQSATSLNRWLISEHAWDTSYRMSASYRLLMSNASAPLFGAAAALEAMDAIQVSWLLALDSWRILTLVVQRPCVKLAAWWLCL